MLTRGWDRDYSERTTFPPRRRCHNYTDSDGNLVSWAHMGTHDQLALIDTLQHWKPDARRKGRATSTG